MNALLVFVRRLVGLPVHRRVPDALWDLAVRRPAWAGALDAPSLARLRDFTERFLADKAISPAGGLELTDEDRVLVALLCCRPVLELGYGWLQDWHEVIVYPDAFHVTGRDSDRDTGVRRDKRILAAGQAWGRGPVILSWARIRSEMEAPEMGSDVVVHEIAHKLDVLDGSMNGAPPLASVDLAIWARDFQAAFAAMRADLDRGHAPLIDPYAAESPQEFFAVCSEYWFTAPNRLREAFPAVAALLRSFYGDSGRSARHAPASTSSTENTSTALGGTDPGSPFAP